MRKKWMLFLLFLPILTCAGCSREAGSKTEQAELPTELNWYINFSWFTRTWGENVVSEAITEKTGVRVNFIVPKGNEEEKLDSMIAADTLPDFVTLGWWEAQRQKMVEQDQVYDLNVLAEEYDPYFFKVIDPVTAQWYTEKDGSLYCYPNSSYKPKDIKQHDNISGNLNFLVRKDMYEAIGCPDMTTREGFENAVKMAVQMFPEVEGKPLIPIGADEFGEKGCNSFDRYLQNMLAVPYEKDGKFNDRYTDPDYLSWLKLFRRLTEEGVIRDEIFFDKRVQLEEKLAEGRIFCLLYQGDDMMDQQKKRYAADPASVYLSVEGPRNSKGEDPIIPTTGINGWTVTYISKNCKEPDKAISFLSYLLSEEGQKMVCLGVEGITYDMEDGKPVVKKEVSELLNSDREKYDKCYGADNTYWMMQNEVMQLQWQTEQDTPVNQLKEWTYPYAAYIGPYEILFEDKEQQRRSDDIERLWGQYLPRLLLAADDAAFDTVLESYKEERDALGYALLMEESTRQMQVNKEKLGM